jgi:hypothetical protein
LKRSSALKNSASRKYKKIFTRSSSPMSKSESSRPRSSGSAPCQCFDNSCG